MNDKTYISLRYWLLGKEMHLALKALEYGASFHTGFRKDKSTPEYYHQLSIASYIRTFLNHLNHPEETLASAFLHDVCEDYDVSFEEIKTNFGLVVEQNVRLLTKKFRNIKIPMDLYYDKISQSPIASIVKGTDRINNIQTMTGVFTKEKQLQYIEETENLIITMLKKARRQFTTQEPAYENIKFVLRNQIELIREIHNVDQ